MKTKNKKIVNYRKVIKKIPAAKKVAAKRPVVKRSKKKTQKVKYIFKVIGMVSLLAIAFTGALSLKPTINDDVLSATTSSDPPLAPTKLVATVKNSTVTLTWDDNSNFKADKYVVYRYDNLSGDYVIAPKNRIISPYSRKYVSSANDSGRTYLYKVAGIRYNHISGQTEPAEVAGPMSDSISVQIQKIKTPSSPTKLRAMVKNSLIYFSWQGSADIFKLERYNSSLSKYVNEVTSGQITTNSFSNRVYEPGKTYKFRLSAYNNVYLNGQINSTLKSSGYATITVKVPDATTPAAPTGLRSTIKDGTVKLSWANPSKYKYSGSVAVDTNGVDGYEIMKYSVIAKEWVSLSPSDFQVESDRVLKITNQVAGETKQYKIRGYKKIYDATEQTITNLVGPYSEPISVTLP